MPDPILNPTPTSPPEPSPLALRAALDQRREFLVLLPTEKVKRDLRLDVKVTGAIVSGAIPLIMQHRDAIAAQFGEEGVASLDELQGLVYACIQAEIEVTNAESGTEVAELAARVSQSHRYLVNELESLAFRKLLDASRIDPGRPIQGYRPLVTSTLTLIDLARTILPEVGGKTSLTIETLVDIERVATEMFDTLNARDRGVPRIAGAPRISAAELRTRALSHLVSVYDQVRRMLTYVRWAEGDADAIAPSLYAARRGFHRTSSGSTDAGSGQPNPAQPTQPTPTEPAVTPTPAPAPIDPVPGSGPAPFTS
ncbi:hypothetical protein DB32_001099 [Sandaracinus amylolyticus]|uniref:Uncharacterized protein n=1 Tax=Sandaracinus amylolyticus TaxID=927083 RepID=A0A0F6VZY7_9BACT|nr:hypothetical protein DB32_001099 [Sandaracinus amylolyticus]